MDKPFLDGFSCSWSKQTLLRKAQDSSRMVLYGSVFCELHPHSSRDTQGACLQGRWPFCSLKCCKQLQKFHLLSALYLFFFFLTTVFWLLLLPYSSSWLFLGGVQVSETIFVQWPSRWERASQCLNKERTEMWAQPWLGIRGSTPERALEGIPDAEKASQFSLSHRMQSVTDG